MRSRTLTSAILVAFTALATSGCLGASPDTSTGPIDGAPDTDASCNIIATDLAEYTAELTKSAEDLSTHTPSTRLSFQQSAVQKLTSVAEKIEHDGVRSALLAVRDSSAELIPILQESVEHPDTWTDGSLDADFATARSKAGAALGKLEEICPEIAENRP